MKFNVNAELSGFPIQHCNKEKKRQVPEPNTKIYYMAATTVTSKINSMNTATNDSIIDLTDYLST